MGQNPYFQAFCGMQTFQWKFPCDSSDISYFRTRIGEEGFQEIFNVSVALHGESAKEEDVVIDTTVQEKNSAFPTDSKLHIKIIVKCRSIAKKEGFLLWRSFTHELPKLLRTLRFEHGKKNNPKRRRARKRVRTIAGVLVREISRKLSKTVSAQYKNDLELFNKILQQKKHTKNKIYSLHEPQVVCIAKGKRHKKYEFGAKACIAVTKTSAIIVGAHSLRHTAVMLALLGGNTLEQAQQFARHGKISTTQIYAHHVDRAANQCEITIARAIFE